MVGENIEIVKVACDENILANTNVEYLIIGKGMFIGAKGCLYQYGTEKQEDDCFLLAGIWRKNSLWVTRHVFVFIWMP
jgi:hypothetical protein